MCGSLSNPLYARPEIGRVFTPVVWAKWCCEAFGIYDDWRNGATVIDPTCGEGSFFIALVSIASERGERLRQDDVRRLHGVELRPEDKTTFLEKFVARSGFDFPVGNIVTGDFLDRDKAETHDIAIGNPPWINFADLPDSYKEKAKAYFIKYGLVRSRKDVLLGASRVDLASLIIRKCMLDHVSEGGRGVFLVPLSLLFNEDANRHFRPEEGANCAFSVDEVREFEDGIVFENVTTRNGLVSLRKGTPQRFPVPFRRMGRNGPASASRCYPSSKGGAWMEMREGVEWPNFDKIVVEDWQKPRQGINTGGLNRVFMLDRLEPDNVNLGHVEEFENGHGRKILLETDHLVPLAGRDLFGGKAPDRRRYLLCLHDRKGKILSEDSVRCLERLWKYVREHEEEMKARKGVLIQSFIRNGRYWSLLGVGPYTFSCFKVVWEAFGKRSFKAVVVDGKWQGNQAMHAYIPSNSSRDAERICRELNERVPAYLEAFGMEGTCNWAQPGRIARLLEMKSKQEALI